jgi:hypothetical protein
MASVARVVLPIVQAARDRGIGPWLEFGDVEEQLRVLHPVAVRKEVPAPMVPFYGLLAAEHGYQVTGAHRAAGAVRLVLLRLSDRPAPVGLLGGRLASARPVA